ncbi:MAG: maleylpyruvate isomerase family mycothiol-dependent enzyme [Acidimicrobiales bacterium]|jgi:uncharacterized protein (TIGR03083 family)|nr:maleylpyruvate isomerase family mycothiol-dependent enzyme [Acidimicrobiales bacterium]
MSEQSRPDDRELVGLDPYDLLDEEAGRIRGHLATFDEAAWAAPSGCAGWSVRDLAAHLAATEEYHHACLDDTLGPLLERGLAAGATDVHSFNALGVRERAERPADVVVEEWWSANAETRRRLRERDGGDMATMVGPYPVRWQAFHLASELATHADDLGVAVADAEATHRLAWRARFSRFALAETRPDLAVAVVDGGTHVRGEGIDVVVEDASLVAAVAGRLVDTAGLDDATRTVLSTMP